MHIVTVFDRLRSAEVRALARSLRAFHPEARMTALFAGEAPGPPVEGTSVVSLDEAWSGEAWWPSVACSAPEFHDGVLVAPLLRAAIDQDDGPVVLLGCQTLLLGPLTPLLDALQAAEVVLVPMAEAELPRDDEEPEAGEVAGAGVVNRRILGLRTGSGAQRLLMGWPRVTLAESGGSRPELVADTVQRYLDRFATLDDAALVLKDPGLGVGYWNLPLRPVEDGSAGLTTGGAPLRLLDLAGFDPGLPGLPWPAQTRFRPSSARDLIGLLDAYGRQLRQDAKLHDATTPFRHDRHGRPLDEFLRARIADAIADGTLQHPPWTDAGTHELDVWLAEPAERGHGAGLTRYHLLLWEQNAELRIAYPDLHGADAEGYAGWLTVHGTPNLGIPSKSLPHRDAAGAPAAPEVTPWGVNVAGFFVSELGIGEAARLLIAGLDAAAVPALPVQGALLPPSRRGAEFRYSTPQESFYPINIVCMNGDSIPYFAREVDPTFFSERYTIALWWWEIVGAFPENWKEGFPYVDEVWVATDHIHAAVAPYSPKAVVKVPMPVTMPRVLPYDRASLGLPADGFLFLYIYDYNSTAARKNPVGHVEAFKAAFPPGSGAKLVLKCINAELNAGQHERTLLAAAGHPDITIIDRYVSADEKNAMLARCDCYLSLHRSEGFGLTPAEAMALGKPVIATRYGGTMEFMSDETAYLVDHRPVAVGPDAYPYPPEAMWVEPDLDHAASLMRRVFERRTEAREVGRRAARHIAEHHAPASTGRIMRERLELAYGGLMQGTGVPVRRTQPQLDELRARIDADPAAPSGPVKSSVRKASSRVVSPFVAHQRRIDQELFRSVEGLERDVGRLGHLADERTQNFAAVRRIRAQLTDHERWLATLEARLQDHHALPYMSTPFEAWTDAVAGVVEGFREPRAGDEDAAYRGFEDRFRGARERIVELQRPYGRLLADFAPALDCGCGRGELLEVLTEAGIESRGVDLDTGMLEVARSAGLEVEHGDATEVLARTPVGSLGAVTAMQVVEHLPYTELQAFLLAACAALRPGGRLVLETVNPHMPASMKGFWLDPTHQHPLFPEVLLELCREAGFASGFVFHPNGTGSVEEDRFSSPAYAVVAEAPAAG